jgi:hypothetical protein
MNTAESAIEKLARVSADVSREQLTEFHTTLLRITAAINEGDADAARMWIVALLRAIAGLYALIHLELPSWCHPSIRQELGNQVAGVRQEIYRLDQVRQHEKREHLERELGSPPPRAN